VIQPSGKDSTQVVTTKAIKDFYTYDNQGVILLNHKSIQAIYDQSGPLAKSCEFQVHYWTLNLRYRAEDDSILDIAIPTVYFNYEQKVSGAHIDFEMEEVKDLSEKLEPLHNVKVNELLVTGIVQRISDIYGVAFQAMSSDINSIHRHPGGSSRQSFSGTDLMKTPNNLGVVFPLESGVDDTPNFAGIMALDSGENNTAHYEYRVVNGTLGTDIEYVKGMCTAITIKPAEQPSMVARLFGKVEKSASTRRYSGSAKEHVSFDLLESEAENLYLNLGFEANCQAVRPENVKAKPARAKTITYTTPDSKKVKTKAELEQLQIYQLNQILKELDYAAGETKGYTWTYMQAPLVARILKHYEAIKPVEVKETSGPTNLVPDNPEEHYKDVVIKDRAALDLMNKLDLMIMLGDLYILYYATPLESEASDYTDEEIVDEILVIQDGILEEVSDAKLADVISVDNYYIT